MERGRIFSTEAYARGKMLDHSEWTKIMPRNGTPSDIDAVMMADGTIESIPASIDNNGDILMMEFSSQYSHWNGLQRGQRLHYEAFVRAGRGTIIAVLCHNEVPDEGQAIMTISHVKAFCVMVWRDGMIRTSDVYNGRRWPQFLKEWKDGRIK